MCLDMFIAGKYTKQAIMAATNLVQNSAEYQKSPRALEKFVKYMKEADAGKLKEFEESVSFDKKKLGPQSNEGKASLENAHELLKAKPQDKKAREGVVKSLKDDK